MLPILAMLTSTFIIAATATSAGTSSPVTAPVAALTATAAIGIIGYSATTTAVGSRRGEVDASGIVAIVVAVGVVTLVAAAINKATDGHLLES